MLQPELKRNNANFFCIFPKDRNYENSVGHFKIDFKINFNKTKNV